MKRSFLLLFAVLIASGLFFSGCIKAPNYPDTPSIAFQSFTKYGTDSAAVVFTFKDGDGDIGLQSSDTTPPFNFDSGNNIYYYDCFLEYLYKTSDGSYKPFYDASAPNPLFNDTIYFTYRVPNITPAGKVKVLSGQIQVMLHAPYYFPGHTSIEFNIYIYDRALHKSNVITTPPIPVP
ncbi:MAG TPA: hypothetical protein VNG53_03225 [Bacteroidia bacterium]|nr:hypothetical protein [Bacteroidia bacterium]